jgi:3-mercaptopyruvate sulfurtransferase SseA
LTVRRGLVVLLTMGVLLVGAAPAAPPDYPVTLLKVDELKAQLDRGTKADIIDVRHWSDYEELHIKGARSMPLRSITERSKEIKKTGLVVFY